MPAIIRAQGESIRVGHLTPRTGFLGQIGEYGFRGATLAVDEANAAGIKIGGSFPQNSLERNPFNGLMDDLMLFDRSLSAVDVRAQFARFPARQ